MKRMLLALVFLHTFSAPIRLLPYHNGVSINTPEHVLYSLAVTDWYTPEARQEIFRIPVLSIESPIALCQYMNDARSGYIPAIGCRDSYWNSHNFDPYYARQSLMHEFNHRFDFSNPSRPGEDPEFCTASLAIKDFPSVPSWHLAEQPCFERYAYVGEYPWLYPELRKFYPQFSDAAYSRP